MSTALHQLTRVIFRNDYHENPRTFGEALRKARIDAGLQIKDLVEQIGVTEDSVINWEISPNFAFAKFRVISGKAATVPRQCRCRSASIRQPRIE